MTTTRTIETKKTRATTRMGTEKPETETIMKKDMVDNAIWWTTKYSPLDTEIIVQKLKTKDGDREERERVAYIAGEIGKTFDCTMDTRTIDEMIRYLIEELTVDPDTMVTTEDEGIRELVIIGQPNKISIAALTALEKISTNEDIYAFNTTRYGMLPELKNVHRIAPSELRPYIRNTIANIQTICTTNTY